MQAALEDRLRHREDEPVGDIERRQEKARLQDRMVEAVPAEAPGPGEVPERRMDDVEPVLRFFGGAPVRPPVPKRLPRRAEEPPDETGTELRAS